MKKVRVIKLEERKDAQTPNNKEVGYFKEGLLREDPEVGQEFLLYMEFGEPKFPMPIWHTSFVTEILSTDTFKTKNSIYQIIPLDE
jgi:hypothetical protein